MKSGNEGAGAGRPTTRDAGRPICPFDLSGRTVLITGASSGIGRDLALDLAGAGAAIALCARRVDRLAELADEIRRLGGRAISIEMDVEKEASIVAAFDAAEEAFGHVDSVVANAGMSRAGAVVDQRADDFDHVMAVNVRGVFLTSREAARRMKRREFEGARGGRIVLVASIGGLAPLPGAVAYSTSKAAVVMLGQALAQEWVADGINVNVVCPGYIATEMNSHLFEGDQGRQRLDKFPRRRLLSSNALTPMVSYLLADESAMCTGGVFRLDDGQTLR